MNLMNFLSIVLARWKSELAIMMIVAALAAAITYSMPKQYVSTASVVVDVSKSDGPAGTGMGGIQQKVYVATQVEVLTSARVAEEVVLGLSAGDQASYRAAWMAAGAPGEFAGWAAGVIAKSLTVSPARESNVLDISFKADDPQRAARMANAFVGRYVDIAVELRVQPAQKYKSFFEDQANEQRIRLEAARGRLIAFNEAKGIIATDAKGDVETERLADLSKEIVAIEGQLAESQSRSDQAQQNASSMQEVQNDAIIIAMRNDLQRARTLLAQERQNLGDNHPRIVETQRSVDDLNARVNVETSRIRSSLGINKRALEQRLATLRVALEKQRVKAGRLASSRSEATLLQSDVDGAQREYDDVIKRLGQTRLESQATQGNVSVLQEAKAPIRPSSPNAALNMAAGVFVGTFLGILFGLGRELLDRRVRSDDQLAVLLDQPLIGSVPNYSGRKLQALGISPNRGLSGLPRRLPAA